MNWLNLKSFNLKSFILVPVLSVGLALGGSACVDNPGSASINCTGFSITGITFDGSGSIKAKAWDSEGHALLGKWGSNVGFSDGSGDPMTISANWSTAPAFGGISLYVGAEWYYYAGSCNPAGGIRFTDGRINPDADATVVGYCSKTGGERDGGIDVFNPANSHKLFHITLAQLDAALNQAASLGHAIVIGQAEGQQLWALPSNEIKFVNGSAVPFLYYSAPYPGDYCGDGLSS